MKVSVKVDGLRDLDKSLALLSKATARNVLRRVLTMAGQPIADAARQKVPVRSGNLRDSIIVSSKLATGAGKAGRAAYARATAGGADAATARGAARDAARAAGGDSFAEVYVGPGQQPHAHLQEFGSVNNPPHPYMRPAWDENQGKALDIIRNELRIEIDKAAKRAARKAARLAAKGA